jgi:anti-sigma regulatory factor (Ser/Thr protein kinase)
MKRVAVINSDERIDRVVRSACEQYEYDLEPIKPGSEDEAIQALNYDLPELTVLNASDPSLSIDRIVAEMHNDPWLHSGGLIVIYDPNVVGVRTEALSQLNLITFIETPRLEMYFPRVLRIIESHEHILYQRDLHALLHSNFSGSFVMDNDPFDLTTYSNLLANFLYNAKLITHGQKERFYIALMELLVNAIEHGNCNISYEEKSRHLEAGGDPMELIRQKNEDPEIAKKRVYLTYKIRPHESSFTIRDEGEGFDWKNYKTETGEAGLSEQHGRGIFMASHFLSDLSYNNKGNEVRFHLKHNSDEENLVPDMFQDLEEVTFKRRQIVFEEGEKSSYLYYIVSGKFDVFSGDKKISTLTPADIFVGEMSFLLGNRRTATVRSAGRGTLIKIGKEQFINAIKERPYYGLFLARLLSQRLVRLHHGMS